jgi:hypothetical protein
MGVLRHVGRQLTRTLTSRFFVLFIRAMRSIQNEAGASVSATDAPAALRPTKSKTLSVSAKAGTNLSWHPVVRRE